MIHMLVIYDDPQDKDAFDAHYRDVHTPLTRAMPGMCGFVVSRGRVNGVSGEAPYLVADLQWPDWAAAKAAFASPEAKASADDLANLGATIRSMVYESADVLAD